MLFNFSKKRYTPKITVLRPPLFNVARHWFLTLCITISILLVTGIIGAKLFYYGYSEAYKAKAISVPSDPLNANYLKNVVGQRNSVLTSPDVLPRDPSI